jgi:hypothetical protein
MRSARWQSLLTPYIAARLSLLSRRAYEASPQSATCYSPVARRRDTPDLLVELCEPGESRATYGRGQATLDFAIGQKRNLEACCVTIFGRLGMQGVRGDCCKAEQNSVAYRSGSFVNECSRQLLVDLASSGSRAVCTFELGRSLRSCSIARCIGAPVFEVLDERAQFGRDLTSTGVV